MSNFSINLQQTKKTVESEEALIQKLALVEMEITAVKSVLHLGAATARIKNSLSALASDVGDERISLKKMRSSLDEIDKKYTKTEKGLLGMSTSGAISAIAGGILAPQFIVPAWILHTLGLNNDDKDHLLTDLLNRTIDESDSPILDLFNFHAKDTDFTGIKTDDVIDRIHDSALPDSNPLKKAADKLHDINENYKKDLYIKKGYKDQDGWHDATNAPDGSTEADEFNKHKPFKPDITIASVGTGVSGALYETGVEGSYGVASGSAGVALGKADASASAYIGPYGAGVQVGAGVTALTASAQGSIGNEYFNLHGNAEVNVGKLAANAAANVGFMDADGNFNPQLSASASAEAVLIEASATAGATIAGTSVNAKGSVKVGIGAHADVGYSDGVLSLDIGASLGIGVGVSLEIDFSGTVDAVADFAGNAWSGITGLFG